jgi:polar amino acid transport system substrate-binding protein
MKKILSFLVALLFYSHLTYSQELTVSIVTDAEKKDGYLVEITEEAFRRVGYDVQIEYLPWKRALVMAMNQGRYDVLLGAYHTQERAQKMAYSEPIGRVEISILSKKFRGVTYETLKDLEPFVIGHINGATVNQSFDQAAQEYLNVEYVSDVQQNIEKLVRGRIDLVIDKKRNIQEIIEGEYAAFVDVLEFIEPPLEIDYFYNAFPKSRRGFQQKLKDFNRGLQMMKEDGTLELMSEKTE